MDKLEYPALRESVHHCVLPNGLHIYVNVRPEYSKQFAFCAVRYGGNDLRFQDGEAGWVDTPAGVAHFLEHKTFDTPDGNALRQMAARGTEADAFTTPSMTGYFFECVEGFEDSLRALLSLVATPYFTAENVEKERGIIAQEIRMGEDDPGDEVFYQLMEALYARHPIRNRVAGRLESIKEITPEVLYQCHQAFYRPGNMVLCAAGNIDPQQVADIAGEVLTGERSHGAEVDLGGPEPAEAVRHEAETRMPVSMPVFELGFKGMPPSGEESLRQRLLAELVCDVLFSSSAPLYSRLYEAGLLNDSFSSGYASAPGCACLMVGGESRDPRRVRDEIFQECGRVGREGIDQELWDRLKRAAYGTMVRQLNSLESTCVDMAQGHFDGVDSLRFPECFQSIERSDAEELIRAWCTPDRAALSVVWPMD